MSELEVQNIRNYSAAETVQTFFLYISFIYTLSSLWDYQYKYDIVHITLWVET